MRALFVAMVFGVFAGCPNVPEASEKPHPVVMRRERMNRQFKHARKGKR